MTTKIVLENIADTSLATLTGPKVSSIVYVGDDTAAAVEGGQSITLLGSGFSAGASVLVSGTAATVVTVVSSTQLTFTSPPQTAGTYVIYVINSDGGTAISIPGISYSGTPNWSTSAGSLATVYETASISNTVTATGDAPITYSLSSGTLPTGSTLNSSTGLLSGTAPASAGSTTYTFTIQASDLQNQTTNRTFSVTVDADAVTWSSPADNTTYTLNQGAEMSNVTLSATSAAGKSITYTANSLPTGLSISGSNIAGTPTVTANTTSIITATASVTNRTATRTFNWIVSVANDLYFKNTVLLLNGETTTPTWLSDASTNNLLVTNRSDFRTNAAIIPTGRSPYNKTTYPAVGSAWFAGEAPDGPGAYDTLSFQMPQLGTVFTVEFWFYADETSPGLTSTKYFIYSNSGFNIGIYNDRGLAAGTSGFQFQTATGAFSVRTWNHVAVVRTGTGAGEFKMYLNGTLITLASGAFTSATTPLTAAEAKIGGQPNGYQNLFRGNIADFRIVNGTAVYTGNFAAPTVPLTAISGTVFLALQYKQGTTNSGIIDDSTNGLPLIRTGEVGQGSFSPYTPAGWSNYFDGTGDYLSVPSSANLAPGSVFTFEAWIYIPAIVDSFNIYAASNNSEFQVGFNGASAWGIATRGTSWALTTATLPILNQWNHIVACRGGLGANQTSLFLNGVRVANGTVSAAFSGTSAYQIAANGAGAGVWNGNISNLRLVPGVDVYGYTNTTITVPTAPLTAVASTALLTCQNNRFMDNSTNNFTLTASGDTQAQAFSPFAPTVEYSAATHGGSMYFPGTGDYLITPPGSGGSTALDTGAGTSDVTFECWVYNKGHAGSQYGRGIFTFYPNAGYSNSRFMFRMNNGGDQVNVFLYISGALPINTTSTALATPNAWTHLAFVRQSGTFKLYINGVLDFSSTGISASLNTFDKFEIGRNQDGSTPEFNGYISDFRYVKGTAVYTANFTPPTAPLTAISGTQLLLKGTDGGIVDRTGRNSVATVGYTTAEPGRRQPEISTQVKKYGSSSMYFGGNGDYVYSGSSPNFELSAGDFTVEFWMYPTAVSGASRGIFGIGTTDPDSNLVRLNSSAKLQFWLGGSNGGGPGAGTKTGIITCTTTIVVNTWAHVALVRSGSATNNVKLYLNGTQDGQGTATYNIGAKPFGLGMGYPSDPIELYTGYIDDFRITKGVARYTTNFTAPTEAFRLK